MSLICEKCSLSFKNERALRSHDWRKHTEQGINHKTDNNLRGKEPWNKGKTKETDSSVLKASLTYKERVTKGLIQTWKGRNHSEETKQKISKNCDRTPRNGSGIGKRGSYKGNWYHSTWELAWAIYNIDNGITFERNFKSFDYEFEDKNRKYYPDFIKDEKYIEIKGFLRKNDLSKFEAVGDKLIVLKWEDIKKCFDHCVEKYDVSYSTIHHLYDNSRDKTEEFLNKREQKINSIKKEILNSGIDFSKFGWVLKVSKIINVKSQKVNNWMKKNMFEFYRDKCFKKYAAETNQVKVLA